MSLALFSFILSMRMYFLSFFFSFLFASCVFTRTHTVPSHVARMWQTVRALVPRYPYAANGNGRISFCTVVCIDSVVHSPLYARCVLAGIFFINRPYVSREIRDGLGRSICPLHMECLISGV